MNTKVIVATLVAGVVSFLLGWLVFGTLLDSYYKDSAIKYAGLLRDEETMRLWGILLAQFSFAGMLAYVFNMSGISTAAKGFVNGVIISGLVYLAIDLMFFSTMNLYPYMVFVVDVIVNALFGGIVGAVVAFMLGRGKTASA